MSASGEVRLPLKDLEKILRKPIPRRIFELFLRQLDRELGAEWNYITLEDLLTRAYTFNEILEKNRGAEVFQFPG